MEAPQIVVSGICIEWQPDRGTCTFAGAPVAMMWVDSTLRGLMAGLQATVGTPRFELALQVEGRRSVEQDWEVIAGAEDFESGFQAIANIAAVAGWGRWELVSRDDERQACRMRATDTWESRFQQATGIECDSAMVAGKFAGYCSKLFGVNCWATQTAFAARGDPHDEFLVQPSDRRIEEEIKRVQEADWVPRAEADASAEAATLFKLAADSTADIMAGLDRNFRFLFANKAYLRNHQLREEDLIGHHYREVVGDDDFERLKPNLERCFAGENIQFVATVSYPEIGERRMDVTYSPLMRGGACVGLVGSAHDITERMASMQALEQETRQRELLGEISNRFINLSSEDLDHGITRALETIGRHVDADRCYVVRFNFEQFTSTNSHEWRTDHIVSQMERVKDLDLTPYQFLLEAMAGQKVVAVPDSEALPDEVADVRQELTELGIQSALLAPLLSEGKIIGLLGFDFVRERRTFSDHEHRLLELTAATISQALSRRRSDRHQQKLEDQLRQAQKMEAIGQLAGGVAHDFNNMLCAITATTELLQHTLPEADPNRELIDEIATAADRAADLTGQLLAFSRKQVVAPKVIALNDVIQRLHPMLERLLGEDIQLQIKIHSELWTVRLDINLLEQVVINLAVNARDAMPTGGRLIVETANVNLDTAYYETHPDTTPGDYVVLLVSDTGIGMSDDVRTHIFEPFFTTKELGQGTGMGLATVLGIVEQSGGRIEVYSETGHGTSFKVYFPRTLEPGELVRVAPEQNAEGGDETVLVVEDEDVVRTSVVNLLELLGYRVLQADSGADALALVADLETPLHLLLTDVIMPDMVGRELAERLIEQRPSVRVLYASGYTHAAIAHHGVLDEGVHFIAKPYTLKTLARAVRSALTGDLA